MPTRDELGAALRKADAAAKAGDPRAADAARKFAAAIREMDAQPAQAAAPAGIATPFKPAAPANITPMGGTGEWDLSKFEALPRQPVSAATINAPNPIVAAQRASQTRTGDYFAAVKQAEATAPQDEIDRKKAAYREKYGPNVKFSGPGFTADPTDRAEDPLATRAAISFANTVPGTINAILEGSNAMFGPGRHFDPTTGEELQFANSPKPQEEQARVTFGDRGRGDGTGLPAPAADPTRYLPKLNLSPATSAGEMGADLTGEGAAYMAVPGRVIDLGFKAAGAAARSLGPVGRAVTAITPQGAGMLDKATRYGGRMLGTLPENAAHAFAFGAMAGEDGSRIETGAQFAADPLNYLAQPIASLLNRAGIFIKTNGSRVTPEAIQMERAVQTLQRGNATPEQMRAAAETIDRIAPPETAGEPPITAVPPTAPRPQPAQAATQAPPAAPVQPQPAPVVTPATAGGNALPPPPQPPVTAAANAPVPGAGPAGAVPPAGTLMPVGNGVAVDSFNNLPEKTRRAVLRALEASGMNRQQAFDAIRSLNDLPPDRANMFEFELIRRYGGPDKFPNLQANLTAMGSDFSIETPKKGGSPQDVMNKSLLDQAQSEGDYLTRTAEQLFGEGKVATKEELEAFRTQLGGRYRTQLAETYPGMTRLRNAASKQALAASVDAGRKNLTDYLLRPDVIEQVPPWVQDQVMMQVSDDLRWLQKDDAGLQFASKANPELTPLLTSDQTLRYSPQLWRTLVEMYPTQVAHSLQSAYRAAIDDAFSGVSNAIDRTTAKKLMRLRGQSRVRANASDPNKRGFGLLHLLEEASPGYKKLRQEYGDVVGAQKAADMPDSFFRVAKDEEALADFIDVFDNELTPLQQNAVRNGITTQIRQALKNKTEFTQPWEVDASARGHLPNMTAVSSQTFLEALPRVFGRDGERMADAIRLSRANVDNIQAINKNFASGTPKGIDIRENTRNLYEHPSATNQNPIDAVTSTLATVGLGSAFTPGGQAITAAALTGAAGRALYRMYKNGKSLSPSQKEALAEWLFKPRRETDVMPPSTPRGFSKAGYAGNVVTGTAIGAAAGATTGNPEDIGKGAVLGALGGAVRAGLRAKRADASIIKPPAPRTRGGPPSGPRGGIGPAGGAPQITPPGAPPAQMGFFGGGRKAPPKGSVNIPRPQTAAPANAEKILSNPAVARSLSEDQFKPLFDAVNNEMKRLQAKTITLSTSGERIPYTQTREGAAEADRLNKLLLNWFKGEDGAVDVEKLARWSERNDPDRVLRVQSGRVADDLRDGVEPPAPSSPKPPIVKNGFGSSPLPMDEASRMARAREQGFDVEFPVYHGSRSGGGFDEFQTSERGRFGPGVYFSEQPGVAGKYGEAKPYVVPTTDQLFDAMPRWNSLTPEAEQRIINQLRPHEKEKLLAQKNWYKREGEAFWEALRRSVDGNDGVLADARASEVIQAAGFKGIRGIGDGQETVIFDPKHVRRTDATFDPAQSGSSKLLAGFGESALPEAGVGAGSAFAASMQDPDTNGDGIVSDEEKFAHQGAIGGSLIAGTMGAHVIKRGAIGAMRKFGGGQKPRPNINALSPAQSGFGSGRKPPAPKGPPKMKGEGNIPGAIGKRAATGLATGAAVNLATSSDAQEDLTGKIAQTEQDIAALNKALADFDKITDPYEKQRFLKNAGFYAGKIDGNIAGKTTEGMDAWTKKQEAAIAKYEAERVDLVRRDAYQKNHPNPYLVALRDYGPTVAGFAALLGMKYMRGSAAKKSVLEATTEANKINRLITKGPVTSMVNKADQSRAENLNTFWKNGGATTEELPFKQDSAGKWKPNPKAKSAHDLYQDNGYWRAITKYVSGTDISLILGGGADALIAQPLIDNANRKLKEAEQKWKDNPSAESFKAVEDAQNEVAIYNLVQRVGAGLAAGRILGAFGKKKGYSRPMPNLHGAASEQAKIKQYIAGNKPPATPRAPKIPPPPPQLLLPFGGGSGGSSGKP